MKLRSEKLETEKKLSEENKKALIEKDKMIFDFAKFMKENNTPIDLIMQKTGLSKDEIEKL